jgi:hypothetical protein
LKRSSSEALRVTRYISSTVPTLPILPAKCTRRKPKDWMTAAHLAEEFYQKPMEGLIQLLLKVWVRVS